MTVEKEYGNFTNERYIQALRSVNDLQVNLGKLKVKQFLKVVEKRLSNIKNIQSTYLTRSWSARKKI